MTVARRADNLFGTNGSGRNYFSVNYVTTSGDGRIDAKSCPIDSNGQNAVLTETVAMDGSVEYAILSITLYSEALSAHKYYNIRFNRA